MHGFELIYWAVCIDEDFGVAEVERVKTAFDKADKDGSLGSLGIGSTLVVWPKSFDLIDVTFESDFDCLWLQGVGT